MQSNPDKVWVVDDDKSIRWVIDKALKKAAIESRSFSGAKSLLEALNSENLPNALLTDIRMPGMDGLELLEKVQRKYPDLPIIVMTAHSDLDSAVAAFHSGAFEYLPKPFDIKEVVDIVQRACTYSRQKISEKHQSEQIVQDTPEIIGESPAMQEVFRAIGRLARSHITVLINGESGTGKELVAKALHRHSPRVNKSFIALNMAAIPKDLMESELFGYEKGAFTGAQARRAGRFEQANNGTLFLDEIGDMPAELQTRLLRVLSDGEYYPIGALRVVKVDVRIIAATHQNLEQLVIDGGFREDLFHRLNVIRIHIPPLRERSQDISLLIRYFLGQAATELDTEVKTLKPKTEEFLSTLEWPGNVRQLENICRWLTVMAAGREIYIEDLPPELLQNRPETPTNLHTHESNWELLMQQDIEEKIQVGQTDIAKNIIPNVEKVLIQAALNHTAGKRQEAAILLGYGRNTLTRKIKELCLE